MQIFTVDSPEFAEARSAYLIAQASLKLAQGTFERERDLFEKRVCPRKDLLEAEAQQPPPEEPGAGEQASMPDADEDLETRTVSLEEARAMVRRGEIEDLKTVVGLTLV